MLAAWRDDYNRVRPHSALANRTPEKFCNHHLAPRRAAMGKTLTQDSPSELRKDGSQVSEYVLVFFGKRTAARSVGLVELFDIAPG